MVSQFVAYCCDDDHCKKKLHEEDQVYFSSQFKGTVHHDGQVKTAQKREAAGHFAYRDRKQTVMNTSAHCPQHWLYLLRPGLPPCE